jgi:hypothetical protein
MLDFPDAPVVNQLFVGGPLGATVWRWDGTKWLGGGSTTTPPAVIVVSVTTPLPAGYAGFVRVENTAAAPITITLPANPTAGQDITIKDCVGNAGTYPITVAGNGVSIEDAMTLVIPYAYSWVDLFYTGAQWVQR